MFAKLNKFFSPVQLLTIGFAFLILTGAFLLMLPLATSVGESQSFIDALFTATSAVSTTGLIVVDTPAYYSLFGQVIILILIQIGGLGYMVFFVLVSVMLKDKLSINGKKYLRESISRLTKIDLVRFAKLIILYTLIIESIGTIVYFLAWANEFSFTHSFFLSLFHSISAFCTAGFSLFSDSLVKYKSDFLVNINSNFLVITGGLGFFVLYDVVTFIKKYISKETPNRLTVHSRIVISTTAFLLLSGTVFLFLIDNSNTSTGVKILTSSFQAISASTTVGFNSIDIGALSKAALFVIVILMFIGASPGSTGGGIKTTSLAVFSKFSLSTIMGRKNTSFFKRNISFETYDKSTSQIFIAVLSVTIFTLLLSLSENNDFLQLLFEAVSAFGTVGLSTGITPQLSLSGKISIICLMFIGRIGPLVIGLSLFPQTRNKNYKYPEEDVLIS